MLSFCGSFLRGVMMLSVFPVLLLCGLVACGPISEEPQTEPTLLITAEFYPEEFVVYTGQHDIVNILVPINDLNFEENQDEDSGTEDIILFFVEKDLATNEDKGLFIRKNNEVKKLLDNGRDIAATYENGSDVYFAAKDGIYVYKSADNRAEKYGSVTDDLMGIALDNTSDTIYALNKKKELFKVTNNGEKSNKVHDVVNAEQIVMDYNNNLFYYTADKVINVINQDGVKKIEGLHDNPATITLLRPPFIFDEGLPAVVDSKIYIIYPNGTSEASSIEIEAKPTAYSAEVTLIQYYAYNKKIYEFNILAILLGETLDELKNYLSIRSDDITRIASRSRSSMRHSVSTNRI